VKRTEGKKPLGRPKSRWEDSKKKWIFKREDGEAWTGSIWLMTGTGLSAFECGNEPSGTIKYC
jgi:hypothetical protein